VIAALAAQAALRSLFFWPFGAVLGWSLAPWLLIALLAFLWLRHAERRR